MSQTEVTYASPFDRTRSHVVNHVLRLRGEETRVTIGGMVRTLYGP